MNTIYPLEGKMAIFSLPDIMIEWETYSWSAVLQKSHKTYTWLTARDFTDNNSYVIKKLRSVSP